MRGALGDLGVRGVVAGGVGGLGRPHERRERERAVGPGEPFGGVAQHRDRGGRGPRAGLDLAAQQFGAPGPRAVPVQRPDLPQDGPRPARAPARPGVGGGGQQPVCARAAFRRQRRGALPRLPRVAVPARPAGPRRRLRQLVGDPVVGLAGQRRPVPDQRRPLPVLHQHLREQRVRGPPLGPRRLRPQRRPDEPVPHDHRVVPGDRVVREPQQARLARRLDLPRADPGRPRGPRDRRRAEPLVRRHHQHEPLRARREPQVAVPEQGAQDAAGRQRAGRRGPAGQLRGGQPAGQLPDGERAPARQVDDLLRELGAERVADGVLQDPQARLVVQRRKPQVRDAGERRLCARGEDDRERLVPDAARREREGVQRDPVQPLRVVHPAQHGPGPRGEAQQLADRRVQDERGRGVAAGQRGQRRPERRRQLPDQVRQGPQQPVQPRVRDVRLGRDADGREHPEPLGGGPFGGVQQGRLAHARVGDDGQRSAVPAARPAEEPFGDPELPVASVQPIVSRQHTHGEQRSTQRPDGPEPGSVSGRPRNGTGPRLCTGTVRRGTGGTRVRMVAR
ncbi:hypothetical protein amrb99_58780 [Actinomadura sp. RB99]|nr:hypothetical protein [Actinomadura sp. RB99]